MKKRVFFVTLYILAFISVAVNMVFSVKETLFPNIEDLPVGTLIVSVDSPEKDMSLNIYVVENSLGKGIRGEIQKGDKTENVYWQTGIEKVKCGWHNEKTVVINSVFLDVARGDKFDCRSDVSILQNNGLTAEERAVLTEKPY